MEKKLLFFDMIMIINCVDDDNDADAVDVDHKPIISPLFFIISIFAMKKMTLSMLLCRHLKMSDVQ